jgi:hypothetical protein
MKYGVGHPSSGPIFPSVGEAKTFRQRLIDSGALERAGQMLRRRLEQDLQREGRRAPTGKHIPRLAEVCGGRGELCGYTFTEAKVTKLVSAPAEDFVVWIGRLQARFGWCQRRSSHRPIERGAASRIAACRQPLTDL